MENEVIYLYLDDIIPNRFQPRENFNEQALKELAVSIKEHGVIQPIVVRKIGEKYEIIAGERRYKASTMAGLTKIPAIVKNLDDKESSKVALIENLQRKDLTPIEEARTYQKILQLDALTQEELAKTMGKSQSAVSNKMRLLSLTDEVQDALLNEKISERHARSLLNVTNPETQKQLLNKIIENRMTVRELDEEIKNLNDGNSGEAPSEPSGEAKVIPTTPVENIIKPNPTVVDIEKIKNESKSINPSNNIVDIEALLNKSLNSKNNENTEPINNNEASEIPAPIIKPVFEPAKEDKIDPVSNTGLPVIEPNKTETVDVPIKTVIKSEKPKSLNEAVTNVKDVVKVMEDNGIKTDVEEFDFDDFYQIVVRIDKNNFNN